MKTITFKIDQTGKVDIAPSGFGSDCITATKEIEDRLGIAKGDREMTNEINQVQQLELGL